MTFTPNPTSVLPIPAKGEALRVLLVKWCAVNGREGYEWSMPIKSCRAVLNSSRLYASAAGARRAGCRAIKRLHQVAADTKLR